MIKTALIVGTMLGAGYYLALSFVWDTAIDQTQAYQMQHQQATTMVEQLAINQPTSNR